MAQLKVIDREALEQELEEDLRWFSQNVTLPEKYEQEPGAFLALVRDTWDRDGRRSRCELGDAAVAKQISDMIGRPFSRSMYFYTFEKERNKFVEYKPVQASISKNMARAFLTVALENWKVVLSPEKKCVPYPLFDHAERMIIINHAVEAMCRKGDVYCRSRTTRVFRPHANIMPILQAVLTSGETSISLRELSTLVELVHVSGLEGSLTPALIRVLLKR